MTSGPRLLRTTRRPVDPVAERSALTVGRLAFGLGLVLAVALALALQHGTGVVRYVPAFAAWYFACAAWLMTTLVLMRRRPDGRLALWTGVGLFALAGTLAVLLLVARGDGGRGGTTSATVPAGQGQQETNPRMGAPVKIVPARPSRGATGSAPSGESVRTLP